MLLPKPVAKRRNYLCLKCCLRCGGDIYKEPGPGAEYDLACLQCGHILSRAEEARLIVVLERQRLPRSA